ncbi:MAG: HNH endonuclease signature motif containing protein [Mycobacterium sp.]
MGSPAAADKEALLAALHQFETASAALGTLSIDGFNPTELLAIQARRETIARQQPVLDHKIYQRLRHDTTPTALGDTTWKRILAERLRISDSDAQRRLDHADVLGPRTSLTGQPLEPVYPNTSAGQAVGAIGAEHLTTITRFFKKLPKSIDYQTREEAEATLAQHATQLGPDSFRQVANRLRYLLNQDGEFTDVDRQAQRCLRKGKQRDDGMVPISGYLTPEAAAAWEAVEAKLAAPGMCNAADEHPTVDGQPTPEQVAADTRTPGQRSHDAFLALNRAMLASGDLGQHNGLPATIIVTAELKDLEKAAGQGLTAGGTLLPMSDVLRLTSHAYLYLALFDGKGIPLHLGRTRRTASPGQRIVLHAQHRGCTAPGCTTPGYRTQVHHANRDWKDGGLTDIEDLTLACGPHNRLIENTGWTTRNRTSDGITEWLPPPHLDNGQPRTNTYHHPNRILTPNGEDNQQSSDDESGDDPP